MSAEPASSPASTSRSSSRARRRCSRPGAAASRRARTRASTSAGSPTTHRRRCARNRARVQDRARRALRLRPPGARTDSASRHTDAPPPDGYAAPDADGQATTAPRARADGAHRRLPADRDRRRTARWRCSTPAGAASPRSRSPRGSRRCARSARTDALSAAIGPGAGPCCYEVGDEVRAAFAGYGAGVRHGRNLDLKAIARGSSRPAGVDDVARRRAVHDLLRSGAVLLAPARSRRHRTPGGDRVVELIHGLRAPSAVRANLERVRAEIAAAGRDPDDGRDPRRGQVRAGRGARRRSPRAGIDASSARTGRRISRPRPRRTRDGSPGTSSATSRAARSAGAPLRPLHPLGRQRLGARPARAPRRRGDTRCCRGQRRRRAGEERGRARTISRRSSSRCPVTVVGLMTMPPLAAEPEDSRPYFAALRELADALRTARICRWERARITSSRWRRARRLCGSAQACTLISFQSVQRVIITAGNPR